MQHHTKITSLPSRGTLGSCVGVFLFGEGGQLCCFFSAALTTMSGSGGLYSGLDVEGVDTAVPDANASQSSRPASSRSFMPAALRRKGKVRNLAHLRPSPAPCLTLRCRTCTE